MTSENATVDFGLDRFHATTITSAVDVVAVIEHETRPVSSVRNIQSRGPSPDLAARHCSDS